MSLGLSGSSSIQITIILVTVNLIAFLFLRSKEFAKASPPILEDIKWILRRSSFSQVEMLQMFCFSNFLNLLEAYPLLFLMLALLRFQFVLWVKFRLGVRSLVLDEFYLISEDCPSRIVVLGFSHHVPVRGTQRFIGDEMRGDNQEWNRKQNMRFLDDFFGLRLL